jgi:hypothetical protein
VPSINYFRKTRGNLYHGGSVVTDSTQKDEKKVNVDITTMRTGKGEPRIR